MKIAKEAYPILFHLTWLFGLVGFIHWVGWGIGLALIMAVAFFFRDPERPIAPSDRVILSAADGTVVEVAPAIDPMGISGRFIKVAIRLSLMDVHINRSPISGYIRKVRYEPGRFLPIGSKRAALANEANWIVIGGQHPIIGVRQVAGCLARRIVCYRKEGEWVKQGDRLGMIRLGSRVELYLPEWVTIKVAQGEVVKAGQTVVALWPS